MLKLQHPAHRKDYDGYGAVSRMFKVLNSTGFKRTLSKISTGENGMFAFYLINELDEKEIFRELRFIKTSTSTAEGNWDGKHRFSICVFSSGRVKLTID